jgi:PTS system nitrogen regulatory IIA component
MPFTFADAAEFLAIPEATVVRAAAAELARQPGVAEECPTESNLLEWALRSKLQTLERRPTKLRLSEALSFGGIDYSVSHAEYRAYLNGVATVLTLSDDPNRWSQIRGITEFSAIGVGDGIGLPHPGRLPLPPRCQPHTRLMFLSEPLDALGPDGKPIESLFLVVTPNLVESLEVMALLVAALRNDSVRAVIAERVPPEHIHYVLRRFEAVI